MRKFVWMTGLFLLVAAFGATSVLAQDTPQAEIFGGYSYVRFYPGGGFTGANLNGGGGSIAYNLNSNFGLVGEFGIEKLSHLSGTIAPGVTGTANVSQKVFTYMFGPRVSYRQNDKFTPFAHVLFGGAHAGALTVPAQTIGGVAFPAFTGQSANAFAIAFGGGFDAKVSPNIAIRLGQVDFLLTRFEDPTIRPRVRATQKNVRLSAGIVFRIGSSRK